MIMNPSIMIVDDDDYTCKLLKKLLGRKKYETHTASDGPEALRIFQEASPDLVLLDQRMPGMSGLEVLKSLKEMDAGVAVIMMTGHGTVEDAVNAMKLGAYDYLTKPFNNVEEIELTVERALKERFLEDENRYLKEQLKETLSIEGVIGKSRAMTPIISLVKKVAPLDSTILIQGETGTGKELVAKTIHQNSSRANRKFVAVNCGALSEGLLESTLFGFEKGAFTGAIKTTPGYFEDADGGTLFLDEITGTSLKLQTSLLRVLQEREFTRLGDTTRRKTDFRLIVATNCDVEKEVSEGRFREDLYYRINVIPIQLPPLRERKEDIPLLVNFFIRKFNEKLGKQAGPLTVDALEVLESYDWKGNVRELENIVERIIALKDRGKIDVEDLPPHIVQSEESLKETGVLSSLPFQQAKDVFEKIYIEEVLKKTEGNVSRAAEITGIKRQNLYLKLRKYGLR